jgi:hypothetical protein
MWSIFLYAYLLSCLFNWIIVFLLLSFESSLYIFIRYVFYKYILPVCGLSFHFLDIVFCRTENYNLNDVQLINFFLSWIMNLVDYIKIQNQT